jgi:hypothetical protein
MEIRKWGFVWGKQVRCEEVVMYGTGATLIDSGIAFLWGWKAMDLYYGDALM